jgi:anti-sigma-K factor RskA
MSKTETLRQSAAAANARQLELLAEKVENVRQAEFRSVEELGAALEPLAQAMVALVDETRETLGAIDRKSTEQAANFEFQVGQAMQALKAASKEADTSADKLGRAGSKLGWRHYALTAAVGAISAALVSGLLLWRAPAPIQNNLDAKAVAEYLKPAVIAALKPSKGR